MSGRPVYVYLGIWAMNFYLDSKFLPDECNGARFRLIGLLMLEFGVIDFCILEFF